MVSRELDQLPRKEFEQGTTPREAAVPLRQQEETYSYLYVDYDLIYIDRNDANKIYGNWRTSAADACADKVVDSWLDRSKLRNYDFVQPCPPSRNGIWRFWVV